MGAGEEAPPRVHTSAMPALVPALAPASLLCGRVNTLKLLSMKLEVTSRPRAGHAAMPNPVPQLVVKVGSGTRVPTSTALRGEEGDDICNEHMGGNADTRSGVGGVMSLPHFNAHFLFSAIKSQRYLMLVAPSKHVVVDLVVGILLVGCKPNICK